MKNRNHLRPQDKASQAKKDDVASEARMQAMKDFVGVWRNRKDLGEPEEYVRKLRKGKRLEG